MSEDIKKIIELALYAPSGENCQPWKFRVDKNVIELINVPERASSLYDWGQRASYLSHGAVIENIELASQELGYAVEIEIFPDKDNPEIVARVKLTKTEIKKDPLYNYIEKRSTNRKPYRDTLLTEEQIKEIVSCSKNNDIKILFIQDKKAKKALAEVGSTNESIMMSNKFLHNFFFSHVNWTKEEDEKKKIGFFIDTLELPPPAKIGFKIFKNWKITNLFNKIGLYKLIGKQNAKIYSSSSGIGIIIIKNMSPENFINSGKIMQRMWLTLTKMGLSLQPLTGVIFFMYKVLAKETEKFSEDQVKTIKKSYEKIKNIFNLEDSDIVAFMFRVGYAEKPSARSVRFNVEEVIT